MAFNAFLGGSHARFEASIIEKCQRLFNRHRGEAFAPHDPLSMARGTPRLEAYLKALTKSTLCQTLKKPARQGSKLAAKGAYIDVSDRRLQAPLTLQAKIPSALLLSEGVFVFAGFVSGLRYASFGGVPL